MSTVLIYTSPARGHLYPMIDVALALRDAGHHVVVQTLADERARIVDLGLAHRPIDPRIEALPLRDYEGRTPLDQMRHSMGRWLARAPHEVTDLRAAVDEEAPDLIVVDANTWGAAAFAQAQGRPWAMFLPYCLPMPSRDAPAFGPGLPAPRGWLGRLRDRLIWTGFHLAVRREVAALNAFRRTLGATPLRRLHDLYLQPDTVLYRTAPPFDDRRSDLPAHIHPLGPGLWAPPGEAPGWLLELPRPRTLVSVSTEQQDDGAIVATALDALADEPGGVIVTTGAQDPAAFQTPHDRVRVTSFLPHAAVVPHVDVVVTHGGMGTTQRALASGVPVVVVPWGRDQHETARRAAQSGAGVRLERGRLDADTLRRAVREARGRQAQAQAVAEGFRAAGGATRAVALLEELLGGQASARVA